MINAWEFEKAADLEKIFVRTGCFCNPGANEKTFGYTINVYEKIYNDKILPHQISIEKLAEFSDGKPIGAIRASFGYVNNFEDVSRFSAFTEDFLSKI